MTTPSGSVRWSTRWQARLDSDPRYLVRPGELKGSAIGHVEHPWQPHPNVRLGEAHVGLPHHVSHDFFATRLAADVRDADQQGERSSLCEIWSTGRGDQGQ